MKRYFPREFNTITYYDKLRSEKSNRKSARNGRFEMVVISRSRPSFFLTIDQSPVNQRWRCELK